MTIVTANVGLRAATPANQPRKRRRPRPAVPSSAAAQGARALATFKARAASLAQQPFAFDADAMRAALAITPEAGRAGVATYLQGQLAARVARTGGKDLLAKAEFTRLLRTMTPAQRAQAAQAFLAAANTRATQQETITAHLLGKPQEQRDQAWLDRAVELYAAGYHTKQLAEAIQQHLQNAGRR